MNKEKKQKIDNRSIFENSGITSVFKQYSGEHGHIKWGKENLSCQLIIKSPNRSQPYKGVWLIDHKYYAGKDLGKINKDGSVCFLEAYLSKDDKVIVTEKYPERETTKGRELPNNNGQYFIQKVIGDMDSELPPIDCFERKKPVEKFSFSDGRNPDILNGLNITEQRIVRLADYLGLGDLADRIFENRFLEVRIRQTCPQNKSI